MRLVIDLSHLLSWSGRLSGIERVEYNIVKHYVETDTKYEVVYIAWDEQTGAFIGKSIEEVIDILRSIETAQQADTVTSDSGSALSFMNRALKKIKGKRQVPTKQNNLYTGSSSDVVFVLDGLWDKEAYISEVTRLKNEADVKLCHIVYDAIPVVAKGYVLDFMTDVFTSYMKQVLPLCDHVYAISQNSADDIGRITKEWNVASPPTSVFQLGDDVMADTTTTAKVDEEPYLLAAGTVEIRKNYRLLIHTYGLAQERGVDLPPTRLVGRMGWLTDEFQYIVQHDDYFKQKIQLLGALSDQQLADMYAGAQLVLCPSLYEGWGLPVREALAFGKVTLASNTSSLPEAGKDLADYHSPHSPEQLLELIVAYQDDKKRADKEALIKKTYQPYTWQQATHDLSAAVEKEFSL